MISFKENVSLIRVTQHPASETSAEMASNILYKIKNSEFLLNSTETPNKNRLKIKKSKQGID